MNHESEINIYAIIYSVISLFLLQNLQYCAGNTDASKGTVNRTVKFYSVDAN